MVAHDQPTPEEAQEQNGRLVRDLNLYYDHPHAEDNASFERIRARLLQQAAAPLPIIDTDQAIPYREKTPRRDMTSSKRTSRHPYLATLLAAALVLALLGSFVLLLQRPGARGSSGQTDTTPINFTLSSCANQPESVLVDLCNRQQLTNLQQAHNLGPYVIELERAYLDMNQLLIIYRVFSQASGKQLAVNVTNALVSTTQGVSFQQSSGSGLANGLEVMGFNTPILPANTTNIQLQVTVLTLIPVMTQAPRAGTPPQQPSPVSGSASFAFTLPFHSGLVVTPRQTLKESGISVTLERVLISPSETIVEGTTKGNIPDTSNNTFVLDAAGIQSAPTASQFGGDSGPFRIEFDAGLLDRHGTWTFSITSLPGQPGPWVFHFNVP